jgi:NAD(P)H-flavin reductase
MPPEKMLGKVGFKANLAGKNWLIRIGFERKMDFIPGQYASLKVNGEGMRRSYSVASLPGEKSIDLLVDVTPMGVGSKYILGLKVGDEVEILGFLGKFTVDPLLLMESKQILFLATGTGIAPLKPMIEDLLYKKHFLGEVRLIWGMRHEEELYWLKEMDNINRNFDNFRFDVVISQSTEDWPGFKGHVGVVVDQLHQEWKQTLVFLCGSPEMIAETEMALKEKGVPGDHIFFEKFF